jgi:hypothetical protein
MKSLNKPHFDLEFVWGYHKDHQINDKIFFILPTVLLSGRLNFNENSLMHQKLKMAAINQDGVKWKFFT